jgi:hypothetical protein
VALLSDSLSERDAGAEREYVEETQGDKSDPSSTAMGTPALVAGEHP